MERRPNCKFPILYVYFPLLSVSIIKITLHYLFILYCIVLFYYGILQFALYILSVISLSGNNGTTSIYSIWQHSSAVCAHRDMAVVVACHPSNLCFLENIIISIVYYNYIQSSICMCL